MRCTNRGDDPPTPRTVCRDEIDDLAFLQTAVLLTSVRSFRSFVRLFVSHGNRASFPSPPHRERVPLPEMFSLADLTSRNMNLLHSPPWQSAADDDEYKKESFWCLVHRVLCDMLAGLSTL